MSESQRIDWDLARRRLEHAERILQHSAQVSPVEAERIYRERAERIARSVSHGEPEGAVRILVFSLGGTRFGIMLANVAEVIAQPKISPVPGAPPEVRGLIQVRGEVQPVWDLRFVLDLPREEESEGAHAQIVLLRRGSRQMGIVTDRVEDIQSVAEHEKKPAPTTVMGAGWMTAEFTTVLDTKRLFEKFQDSRTL